MILLQLQPPLHPSEVSSNALISREQIKGLIKSECINITPKSQGNYIELSRSNSYMF